MENSRLECFSCHILPPQIQLSRGFELTLQNFALAVLAFRRIKRYVLLKNCSGRQNLLEVAKTAQSCSNFAEHNWASLIAHPWQLLKEYISCRDPDVDPSRLLVFSDWVSAEKFLVFNWLQAQVQADCFAMVRSLLFVYEVNYKFIYGSFTFSLG